MRKSECVAARRSLTEAEAHIILAIRLSAKPRFCTPERKLKEVLMVGGEGLWAFVVLLVGDPLDRQSIESPFDRRVRPGLGRSEPLRWCGEVRRARLYPLHEGHDL
jgi:hypothetical protein